MLTCPNGKLYLWEYPRQLREVDVTIRPDEPEFFPPPLPPGQILISSLHLRNNPVFFHPTDHRTFYVASYWAQPWNETRMMLFVHEFRPVDGVPKVVRCFGRDVAACMPSDLTDLGGPHVMVQRVDAKGTFQLLTFSTKAPPNDVSRTHHVTFNPLTASFGVELYENPWDDVGFAVRPFLWEKQMLFPVHTRLISSNSTIGFGALNHLDGLDSPDTPRSVGGDGLRRAVEMSLASSNANRDVTKCADLSGSDLHDHHHLYGIEFACRLPGESCTFPGPHIASCEIGHPLKSVLLGYVPNHSLSRRWPVSAHLNSEPRVKEIFVDYDLVIVVTEESYTVFYVDVEGNIADAIKFKHGQTQDATEASSDQ